MADKKITQLPPATAVALTDLIPIVSDPGGVPVTQKATVSQLQTAMVPFSDSTALLMGSVDPTKLLRFEVDGFTAGATRVLTPPNSNITLAGIDIANAWSDGVTQTFNPNATSVGLNVGAHTSDPSSLNNGDVWYHSANNELRARINGASVALGASGGSAPFIDSTAIIKGSSDASKLFRIEVDGFTSATTRVATPPNQNFTMAGSDIANAWSDGVTQTFNPNATNSGLNVGAHTADPSSLNNGDVWYQSTANELHARINGATVSIGGGAPFIDSTAIIKGSADATKLLRFEVDGFTTATTRVATPPNQDFTIAGINVQQTFTQKQTFTPPVNTESIVVSGFSLTGSNTQSLLDLSGTWNTTGLPTAIKLSVTDSASNQQSLLMSLVVNGTPQFTVDKSGDIVANSLTMDDVTITNSGGNLVLNTNATLAVGVDANAGLLVATHSIQIVDGTGTPYNLLCRSIDP